MEEQRQNSRVRRNAINFFHRKIKENPEIFDFYSNAGSSILTLLALLATVYFSISALKKTDTQNKNAEEQLNQARAQLKLAQDQFNYSKQLHYEDSLSSALKDKRTEERFIRDTLKQGQQEEQQNKRNKLQDLANKQQYVLNKNQLKAIQIQAKIAQDQYNQQLSQYKQQLYEQRPVFNIDSVHVSPVNAVKSTMQFHFSNVGIRFAHVDSTLLAFYNPQFLDFSVTKNSANLDLVPYKSSIITPPINIYQGTLNTNKTIFYLLIYYKDLSSGKSSVEPIFFSYEWTKQKQFLWRKVTGPFKDEFVAKLRKKHIFLIE